MKSGKLITGIILIYASIITSGLHVVGEENNKLPFEYDNAMGVTRITNDLTGAVIDGEGPEFIVRLMDGTEILPDEMTFKNQGGDGYTVVNSYKTEEFAVNVTYSAREGKKEFYKDLKICNQGGEPVELDSVTVLKMSGIEGAYHGGFGEPVFAGDLFFGLEYPAGYNLVNGDTIELKHYPGKTLSMGECLDSKTAVIGVSAAGDIEDAFKDYVDSIRYSKSSNLHYNSWYDVREEGMSVAAFEEVYRGLRDGLEKHGLSLDFLVVDDGWQDRNTIWETSDRTFPDGFAPLRKILEAGGTKFGLWLPYSGTNLNVDWGLRSGYEVNNKGRYYCAAGKKYNGQLRKRLKKLIEVDGVRMFKHDFNEFRCYSDRVDYPQTERHSIEANVDAEIELMNYTHSLQPDLFLNVTSSMWLSPWWLMYADTIWMGSADYGWDMGSASPYKRDWAMTYRDGWLYRRLVEEGHRFPMNAVMTHGIIDGVRNRLGGEDEGWRTWADNVILYFGRGVYMRELYISPQLMDERKWKFLADAAKWAKAMDPVFARTEWVGGDPRKGEAYGYHHYGGGQDWYVLRNPDMRSQEVNISVPEGGMFQVVYPGKKYISGGAITLRGLELIVGRIITGTVEAVAEQKDSRPSIEGGKCVSSEGLYTCDFTAVLPAGSESLMFVVLRSGELHLIDWLRVNGERVEAHDSDNGKGIGWRIFPVDSKTLIPGEAVEVKVEIPDEAVRGAAFAAYKYTFSAYLESVAAAEVEKDEPDYQLPPVRDAGKARIVVETKEITIDFSSERFAGTTAITEDDLAKITEAKLRLKVFGSQGGEFKTILVNNALVGALPSNNYPHDQWEEFVIDFPAHRLGAVKLVNKVVINDMSEDDGYKFSDLQLAVRLVDGTWRHTNVFDKPQSSSADWEYTEGPAFDGKSKPVKLAFEETN